MIGIQFKQIIYKVFLLTLIYTVVRALFLALNKDLYLAFPPALISSAFLHGLRFDIAAIVKLNLFLFLFWMLPFKFLGNMFVQNLMKWVFIILNTTFISANLVDIDLIQFTGQRMTMNFWSLGGDWLRQAPQLLMYYWKLTFVGFVLLGILIMGYPKWEEFYKSVKTGPIKSALIYLVFLLLTLVAVRGGVQLKPISVAHANVFPYKKLNDLVLNSTFSLLAPQENELKPVNFFSKDSTVLAKEIRDFKKNIEGTQPPHQAGLLALGEGASKPNIVLIVMESFSLEYTGFNGVNKGYTPFLNQLGEQGLVLRNHFSNGRRSIEALPSLLCAIPQLQKEAFLTSPYQSIDIKCLPQTLKEMGYSNSFFHGAKNGTMYFDTFSERIGFDRYYGLDEYPYPDRDFDGAWGVFDEPFLQYMVSELNKTQTPFFTTFFSLSSHQPYSVPEKYAGRFPKGNLEIHESVGYADYALKQFFEKAKTQSWYENTLFIITADHTQKSSLKEYENELGHYRVPLIFYHPKINFKSLSAKTATQHTDLFPTLLNLMNLDHQWVPFGQSVFGAGKGIAVIYNGADFFYFDGDRLVSTDDLKQNKLWNRDQTPWKYEVKSQPLDEHTFLKNLIQFYQTGLVKNSWYKSQ